jgi:hypothetical protein
MTSAVLQPSGTSPSIRKYVWERLLDAEMNDRYWRDRAAIYATREKGLKIFLAITSSGTVAGWVVWQNFHLLWQVLSGMSALLAIALPILDYTGQVERASDVRKGWWELTTEYNRVWVRIDLDTDASIQEKTLPLEAKELNLVKIESRYFSRDETLIRKAQQDVLRARGLASSK